MYYQVHGRYQPVRLDDARGFNALGADLTDARSDWKFAVQSVTPSGFRASALGRDGHRAEGIFLWVRLTRGQPPVWMEQ